ncbi:hypothetical protein [uncultured Pantoea sp.]|uniref:hypothetical protein n=1 Tax=uncultured Pantoea sp. TaxID=218084 RepID=UPI0025837099|nr:hypothetical protein [uncultured Pantoea sp.]
MASDLGFPPRAQNFVESRLDLNKLFAPHPDNMIRIETPTGFALVDRSLTPEPGDKVAFRYDSYPQLGKLFRSGIITQNGETIDGGGLEGLSCWDGDGRDSGGVRTTQADNLNLTRIRHNMAPKLEIQQAKFNSVHGLVHKKIKPPDKAT